MKSAGGQEMKTDRQLLESDGFIFFKSLKAGVNSTYTFKKNGIECGIGFDSINQAVNHIINQGLRGKDPFMIF